MARPVNARVEWFLTHRPSSAGMCLNHTWLAIELGGAGIASANAAVHYLRENHKLYQGMPPRGAMVLWTSGTFGHAALSLGRSPVRRRWMIASTDVHGPATVGRVPLSWPTLNWGHQYAGWSNWWAGETYEVGWQMQISDKDKREIANMAADAVWNRDIENTTNPGSNDKRPAKWFLNSILDKVKPK